MKIVDIHSHVLPGMDDGSHDMEQSVQMLRLAREEGITHMILTPHYKQGRYRADTGMIHSRIRQLQELIEREELGIQLYAGTEAYYRSGLAEKLEEGELCTLNGTNSVLLEFSPFEEYLYIRNSMDELLGMGYQPVLAHVERYQCLVKDIEKVRYLKDMGCEIQVNAGSISGNNGFGMKRFTHKLLKEELVDYLGTDAHDMEKRKPLMKKCVHLITKKCRTEYAEALLFGNAETNLLIK